MTERRLGVGFLFAEAVGGAAWWVVLVASPASRRAFRAADAPDVTLLAFAAPDILLYVGGAAVAGYGYLARRRWAWAALCVHAGAAAYAGLYCWALTLLSGGDAWLGAVLMSPSLVGPGVLARRWRPAGGTAC